MKERTTMQRLMQEGWIPVLIGILSASVIVSLAHSTGMAYVTGFLLLTLYFVAIAANRVDARAIVAAIIKRLLQQAGQTTYRFLRIRKLDDWRRHVVSLWLMQIDLTRHHIEQSNAAFIERLAGLEARIASLLLAFIAPASLVASGGIGDMLKNSKTMVDHLIQVIKRAV